MDAISRDKNRFVPASTVVEFALLRRLGRSRREWLAHLFETLGFEVAGIDSPAASIAADAAERYGHGSGHPARLNFGDCLSYAVAKQLEAPLLYTGDDFSHTDIESALPA